MSSTAAQAARWEPPADGVPSPLCFLQTIENTRVKDVTIIAPNDNEVDADDAQDEFAGILRPAVQQMYWEALHVTHGSGILNRPETCTHASLVLV